MVEDGEIREVGIASKDIATVIANGAVAAYLHWAQGAYTAATARRLLLTTACLVVLGLSHERLRGTILEQLDGEVASAAASS
jgi:hypothetical protein